MTIDDHFYTESMMSPTGLCWFEASSLNFGSRHLGFLKPEVTIFGKEGDTEAESHNARRL